jgi:hypothetical protein
MNRILIGIGVVCFAAAITKHAAAQERLKTSDASVGATNTNPTNKLTVDDIVDDAVVREIEKDGLIERLYR